MDSMETREASPAHLLIKIKSFSLLSDRGIDKYETSEFAAGNYKWKLIIYPDGHGTDEKDDDKEEYVSVYLAVADTKSLPGNWEVNVNFSICILNQISGKCLYTLGRTRRFFAMKTEWGFSKFMSKKMLTDPSSGYLVDDKCVFGAEVFVNQYKPVTECLSLKNDIILVKQNWKISDFSTLKTDWTSEVFTAGGHEWKIQLHPNGNGDGIGRYLSIFLHHVPCDDNNLTTPGEKVKASYTIWIKNQLASDKHHKETLSHWFSASCLDWGWPTFISLVDLNDPKNGFLVKDGFLLELEMSVQAVAHWSST